MMRRFLLVLASVCAAILPHALRAQATSPAGGGPAICGRPGRSLGAGERERTLQGTLAGTSAGQPSELVGQVERLDGRPIAGVTVALQPFARADSQVVTLAAMTDSLGQFRLSTPNVGSYRLALRRVGFAQQIHAVAMNPGVSDTVCIRLRRNRVTVAPVKPATSGRRP